MLLPCSAGPQGPYHLQSREHPGTRSTCPHACHYPIGSATSMLPHEVLPQRSAQAANIGSSGVAGRADWCQIKAVQQEVNHGVDHGGVGAGRGRVVPMRHQRHAAMHVPGCLCSAHSAPAFIWGSPSTSLASSHTTIYSVRYLSQKRFKCRQCWLEQIAATK